MTARNEFWFDDEYTGPRWTYGLTYRPLHVGAQPDGYIIESDRPSPDFPFGTIDYPFALTDEECRAFDLTLVAPSAASAETAAQARETAAGLCAAFAAVDLDLTRNPLGQDHYAADWLEDSDDRTTLWHLDFDGALQHPVYGYLDMMDYLALARLV